MKQMLGFNPLLYLGIDSKDENTSFQMMNQISEYLIIRIAELMDDKDLEQADNEKYLFEIAEQKIPDFNNKIKQFLEDFRREFDERSNQHE